MTVARDNNRLVYSGDGTQAAFAAPYFTDPAQIVVLIRPAGSPNPLARTLGTHFTLTGERDPNGGLVTFIVGGDVDWRPPAGSLVVIRRVFEFLQPLDLVASGQVRAEPLERQLDFLTMIAQQLRDVCVQRAYQVPPWDRIGGEALPVESERAGRLMGWDLSGRVALYAMPDVVQVPVVTPARYVTPTDLGLAGDGQVDDRNRIVELDDGVSLRLPKGRYRIGSDLVIFGRYAPEPGAVLVIPAGVTVRLVGPILAGRHRLFEGAGTLLARETNVVYPEWFGAFMDGETPDTAALQACLDFANRDRHRVAVVDLGGRATRITAKITQYKNVLVVNGLVNCETVVGAGDCWEIRGTDAGGETFPAELGRHQHPAMANVVFRGHATPGQDDGVPRYTPGLVCFVFSTSNFSLHNVHVTGFDAAFRNGENSYILELYSCKALWCNHGFRTQAQANSGERWTMIGGAIGACNYAITNIGGGGVNLHCNNVSLDYLYKRVIQNLNKVCFLTDCHIEHLNRAPEGHRFVVGTDGFLSIRGGDIFDDHSSDGPLFLVDGVLALADLLVRVPERHCMVELAANGRVYARGLYRAPGGMAELVRVSPLVSGVRNGNFALPQAAGVIPGWTSMHGTDAGLATPLGGYDGPRTLSVGPVAGVTRGVTSARVMIPAGAMRARVSVNLFGGGAGGTATLRVRQFQIDGTASVSTTSDVRNGATDWVRLRVDAGALASGGTMLIDLFATTTNSETPYHFDGVYVEFL